MSRSQGSEPPPKPSHGRPRDRTQRRDNGGQSSDNGVACEVQRFPDTVNPMSEACPVPNCTPERCAAPAVCPLNRVRAGTTVVVKRLTASPDMNQRLREMGFGEEQRVKVLSLANNLLCQVCNARLGLSERLAETILVQPLGVVPGLPSTAARPVRLAA